MSENKLPPSLEKTNYVCGFYFNKSLREVILIWKEKPKWQKGKLNGVGGHIEKGELAKAAMVREFKEETGLYCDTWIELISLCGSDWICHFFCAADDKNDFDYAETMEEEEVAKIPVDDLYNYDHIENLTWLVPMAAYKILNTSEFATSLTEQHQQEIERLKERNEYLENVIDDKASYAALRTPITTENEFHVVRKEAKRQFDLRYTDDNNGMAWHFWKFAFQYGFHFARLNGEQEDKRSVATKSNQGEDAGNKNPDNQNPITPNTDAK